MSSFPSGPLKQVVGRALVIRGEDIDTDRIIPARFLKCVSFDALGDQVFADDRQELKGEHPFDQERFQGASILVVNGNFGCGSSREHAPWALLDFGFRCIIGPSFADIFFNNCRKNGILLVVLNESQVQALFEEVTANEGCQLKVDLQQKTVSSPAGLNYSFEIDDFARQCLLGGMDDIGWTLQFEDRIGRYEQESASQTPWLSLSA